VIPALTAMQHAFGASTSDITWVLSAEAAARRRLRPGLRGPARHVAVLAGVCELSIPQVRRDEHAGARVLAVR
jgi:hypothetical protein